MEFTLNIDNGIITLSSTNTPFLRLIIHKINIHHEVILNFPTTMTSSKVTIQSLSLFVPPLESSENDDHWFAIIAKKSENSKSHFQLELTVLERVSQSPSDQLFVTIGPSNVHLHDQLIGKFLEISEFFNMKSFNEIAIKSDNVAMETEERMRMKLMIEQHSFVFSMKELSQEISIDSQQIYFMTEQPTEKQSINSNHFYLIVTY